MRVLADNDVVLDFLLERQPFHGEAKELFRLAGRKKIEIYVASITPVNAFYTIRKERDKQTAFVAVRGILELVNVCRTDKSTMLYAFSLGFSDYEDAVQCASAVAEDLDAIVTRNTKDYANSPIQIYSPAEFLEVLQNESAG